MKAVKAMRRQLLARAAAAAPLLATTSWAGLAGRAACAAPAAPGQMVTWPEVRLLDGSTFGAAQAKAQAVVVVFWSTTCPFCLRHNAHIEKLRQSAVGRPLRVLTVARERDPSAVQRYLQSHGYGFAVTLEHAAMADALSQRKLIPLTVTVDRSGRLLQVIPGEMFEEDVMEFMRLAQ